MRRLILMALCILCASGVALAQMPGSIGVFTDATAAYCDFVDTGGFMQVYFIHLYTDGAMASQFKLDIGGTAWTHLGDHWNFPTVIGNSLSGITIGYGQCLVGSFNLGYANFFGSVAAPCTQIHIVADPGALSGQIEGVDCDENLFYPTGGAGVVNGGTECYCGCPPSLCPPPVVPVKESTWGAIKSMYR
jgi:hypothetical protein